MHKYKKPGAHGKAVVPDAVPYTPPVFDPKTQLGEGKTYLQEHGYVVYNVLDQQQISEAISLLWDFLEGLGTSFFSTLTLFGSFSCQFTTQKKKKKPKKKHTHTQWGKSTRRTIASHCLSVHYTAVQLRHRRGNAQGYFWGSLCPQIE
jgi:hypothetical protein